VSNVFGVPDISTGEPALGTPVITQVHSLIVGETSTGEPSLDNADIAQNHNLIANGIVTDPASLEEGDIVIIVNFVATPIASQKLTLGTPFFGQVHNFGAVEIVFGQPIVPNLFLVEGTQFTTSMFGLFQTEHVIETLWRRAYVH